MLGVPSSVLHGSDAPDGFLPKDFSTRIFPQGLVPKDSVDGQALSIAHAFLSPMNPLTISV